MSAVLARILMRYFAGGLVVYGVVEPGAAQEMALDPDLALLLGAALAALAELAYALARRFGWQR